MNAAPTHYRFRSSCFPRVMYPFLEEEAVVLREVVVVRLRPRPLQAAVEEEAAVAVGEVVIRPPARG